MAKINFKKLMNKESDRNVRSIVPYGAGHITVFEPSVTDVNVILELQESWKKENDEIEVDGTDLIRVLYPLLTDITGLEDMSDKEVEEVLENPSIALMNIKTTIESILIELYSLIFAQARQGLLENNFNLESHLFNKETFSIMTSLVDKHTGKDMSDKLRQATDALLDSHQEDEESIREELKKTSLGKMHELKAEAKLDETKGMVYDFTDGVKITDNDSGQTIEIDLPEEEPEQDKAKEEEDDIQARIGMYKTEMDKYMDTFSDGTATQV